MSDDAPPTAPPSGEPMAGTEPAGPETDPDTVQSEPGDDAGSADVSESGPTAVTPADPAAGESTDSADRPSGPGLDPAS